MNHIKGQQQDFWSIFKVFQKNKYDMRTKNWATKYELEKKYNNLLSVTISMRDPAKWYELDKKRQPVFRIQIQMGQRIQIQAGQNSPRIKENF